MNNNELNLDKYRQAWQRESRRLESSAPLHTEEDILDILRRRNQKPAHRRLPLWIAGTAASLLLLAGALWLLTVRDGAPAVLPARLAEKTPWQNAGSPSGSQPATPLSQPAVAVPDIHCLLAEAADTESQCAADGVPPAASVTGGNVSAGTQERRLTPSPAACKSPYTPEKQALVRSDKDMTIEKKAMNGWMQEQMEAFGGGDTEYNPLTGRTTLSLMAGCDFGQTVLIGAELRTERPSHSSLSANRLMTFTYCGKESEPTMLISYSAGLSWHPAEPLTANVNMGGFLGFEEFEAGLMADIALGWHLTQHLTAGAGYRRLIPFSHDGRNIWYIAIGYTTK